MGARRLHAVQVVEHDHAARRVGAGQRVLQLGHRTPRARAAVVALANQRDQRLRVGAPRQVVRFEGGRQAGEHALRVVVFIERHPRERGAGRQMRPLGREQRGLAEAGRRLQQHHAVIGERLRQRRAQRRALDAVHARARRLDLRDGKAGRVHGGVGRRSAHCQPMKHRGDARK